MTRNTVELHDRADINTLAKAGVLDECGTSTVTHTRKDGSTYDIGVKLVDLTDIQLTFTLPTGKKKRIKAQVFWGKVNYGQRADFKCLGCGEYVKHIYPDGGCRKCCNLGHKATGVRTKTRRLNTIAEIEESMGWSGEERPKPKGMHWSRYDKILAKYNDLQSKVRPRAIDDRQPVPVYLPYREETVAHYAPDPPSYDINGERINTGYAPGRSLVIRNGVPNY